MGRGYLSYPMQQVNILAVSAWLALISETHVSDVAVHGSDCRYIRLGTARTVSGRFSDGMKRNKNGRTDRNEEWKSGWEV